MHKEQKQRRHIQNILGEYKSCQRPQNRDRERKRQWVNHERGSAMADTDIWLGKWHHLFLFSTSLSHIGSEIEKRKIARAQSKNKKSLRLKKREKVPRNVFRQTSKTLDLVSLNLCFLAHRSLLLLAKLTWIYICYFCIRSLLDNPVEKHSKALRKPDYITTSLPTQFAAWRVQDRYI